MGLDFSMCNEPVELVADEFNFGEFFDRIIGFFEPVVGGEEVVCPYCGETLKRLYPDRVDVLESLLGKDEDYFAELVELLEFLVSEGKVRTVVDAVQVYGECKKCGNEFASLKFIIPVTKNFKSLKDLREFLFSSKEEDREVFFKSFEEVAFTGVKRILDGEEVWEVEVVPFVFDDRIEFTCVFKELYRLVMGA